MNKGSCERFQALWTADGRGKAKNQGWSTEGIRRYNELCRSVRVDREKYQIEDEVYLKAKQQERQSMEMAKLQGRQERTDSREQGLEPADNDFSSDESDSDG